MKWNEFEWARKPKFKIERNKEMEVVRNLVRTFVLPNAKAIVALVVGSCAAWLARKGVTLEPDTVDAVVSGAAGVLTACLVWLTPNR